MWRPANWAWRCGFFARRLKILAMLDQFGAERAHGAVLLDRIAPRHIDHGRNAVAAGREGEALPVIAARGGNDPGRVRPLPLQPVEIDQPAAHLEGADRRVVLVLDHDVSAEPLRQAAATHAPASAAPPAPRSRVRVRVQRGQTLLYPPARSSSATLLVVPAQAGTQYSRDARAHPRRRGVLDRPVKPGDDSGIGVQPSILTPAPCRRRTPRRWLRRWLPPAAAFRCAPCRTESSGSSFPAQRPGNRTAPGA